MMKTVLCLNTSAENFAMITLCYQNGTTKTVSAVDYSKLIVADKTVYDNFKNILPAKHILDLENFPVSLDGDLLTSAAVSEERVTLDYSSMSQSDRMKTDAFVALIEKLYV